MNEENIKIICEIDNFCVRIDSLMAEYFFGTGKRPPTCAPGLCLSEMRTILTHFHRKGFRNFKNYHIGYLCAHLKGDFPTLVSFTRFVARTAKMLVDLTLF